MRTKILEKAAALIQQNTAQNAPQGSEPYCVLALIDTDGSPIATTITASKADGLRWITFCTGFGSTKPGRIEKRGRASVCFNTGGEYNITLIGGITIETQPEVKREMWYDGLANHFSGPDDPNYCVLRFTPERYHLLIDRKEAAGAL